MQNQQLPKNNDNEACYVPVNGLESLPDNIREKICTGGGRLPGYGGGDRVLVLLEPGEFIVRKEAVEHYGEAYLEAINDMRVSSVEASWPSDGALPNFGTIYLTPATGKLSGDQSENLEQIQDNSRAIQAITAVLIFISLIQTRPRCSTCGEVHDTLIGGKTVAELCDAIGSLALFSDYLADDTKKVVAESREKTTEPGLL
ncbi:MAG: hypothetical protein AB7U29_12690 [Desulfobulbus sp.]